MGADTLLILLIMTMSEKKGMGDWLMWLLVLGASFLTPTSFPNNPLLQGISPFDQTPYNPIGNLVAPLGNIFQPIANILQPNVSIPAGTPVVPTGGNSTVHWTGGGTYDDPYVPDGASGPTSDDVGYGYGVNDDFIF